MSSRHRVAGRGGARVAVRDLLKLGHSVSHTQGYLEVTTNLTHDNKLCMDYGL